MYAIKQNDKIFKFNNKSEITNANCKAKGIVIQTQGLEYASDETLEELGFKLVVDPELGENQYFSEVKESDGIFYRTAKDIIPPTPQDIFNPEIALQDIIELFESKIIGFEGEYFIIQENVRSKNFTRLNTYSQGLLAYGKITQSELEQFQEIFSFQNINLKEWV